MKTKVMLLLAGVAALTGCATASTPRVAPGIALQPRSSRAVALYQPRVAEDNGTLMLDGWVYRQFGATTTKQTHIDVTFFDENGYELRRVVARFTPNDLRRGSHKMAHRGHYTLPISDLPAGTAAIQVRAHDAPEHQP